MNLLKNVKCAYCIKKIQSKFIFCIQCEVEICIKCFCYGIEGGDHRKTHKYKIESVARKDKVCLFKKDTKWNFDEELKLMDAVIIYKTGNWVDISSMVRTKTSEECRSHFIDNYTNSSFGRSLIKYIKSNDNFSTNKPIFDHTEGEFSPILYEKFPLCFMKSEEEKMLGFTSNRNEFIIEFDDDAEKLISTLEPIKEIDSLISALQTTLVGIYDHRLRQRDRYKRLAREHNLIPHIIAHVLDKMPRDYNHFKRQMLKRIYPSHYNVFSFPTPSSLQRNKSIFGRVYLRQNSSFTATEPSNDSASVDLSTPSEPCDPACHTPVLPLLLSPPGIAGHHQQQQQPLIDDHASWHYNAFLVRDHLRPFLQFLSAENTKLFLENLKKEEQLKSEIVTLQTCVKHGILSYDDYKEKLAQHHNKRKASPNSKHQQTPARRPKRKRGLLKTFTCSTIMKRKRMEKYLLSLDHSADH